MSIPLSILDLAPIRKGQTLAETFAASVALAKRAEQLGYRRVWYAEHHNIPTIASAATSVLIAHVGAHTERIRLGAGGIMLPNHSPLVIAEQFGTLAALHPGRIDLGLGRAPGSDRNAMRALRREPASADAFPDDVVELQAYLRGDDAVRGVEAIPGKGSDVPLYILGSSLFGAQLAAILGLPYAFASHFAPALLDQAVATYRQMFRPSEQLEKPYVIAGVNVLAADSAPEAERQFAAVRRSRVVGMLARGRELSEEQKDALVASPAGQQMASMLTYSAVGDPEGVAKYVADFARRAGADELMVVHQAPSAQGQLRSAELLAQSCPAP